MLKESTFRRIRIITASFISALVAIAVVNNNLYLAIAAVAAGMLFLILVKRRAPAPLIDERVLTVGGRAGRFAYSLCTVLAAILSLAFIFAGRTSHQAYLENLGVIFSYLALFNLAVYALAFKYYNKKYGGED